jgi:hypothetical protein
MSIRKLNERQQIILELLNHLPQNGAKAQVLGDIHGPIKVSSPVKLDDPNGLMILELPEDKRPKFRLKGICIRLGLRPRPIKTAHVSFMYISKDAKAPDFMKIIWFGKKENEALALAWANTIENKYYIKVIVVASSLDTDLLGKYTK